MGRDTKIWAHRGASAYAPENTLAAFALALEQKADGIELDVHFSRDRQVVVTHDDNVVRVTGYNGNVCDLTLAELKKLDFSNKMAAYVGESIPTLDEVFALMKSSGLWVNVELKTNHDMPNGLEEACQALVEKHGMENRVIYSSFNHMSLKRMGEIAPHMPLGILYSNKLCNDWEYAKAIGASAIHPSYKSLNEPDFILACRASGICCNAWTVDETADIRKLLALDVDAIITNKPDLAVSLRDEHTL